MSFEERNDDIQMIVLSFPFVYHKSAIKLKYSDPLINSKLSTSFMHDPTEDLIYDLIVGMTNPYEELSFKDGRITLVNLLLSQDQYAKKIRELVSDNEAFYDIVYELECLRSYIVYILTLSKLAMYLYILIEVQINEASNTVVLYYSKDVSLAHLYDNNIELYSRFIMKRI